MEIKEYVQKYDPQNQFDVLVNSYKQIEFAWNNEVKISNINATEISNIIVSGLGGSAISADLMRNFLGEELRVPYIVNRNYDLPKFANKNTLFVASSYSGLQKKQFQHYSRLLNLVVKLFVLQLVVKWKRLQR